MRAYSKDWMHRIDKFIPIERTSELLIPAGGLILLGLTFVWVLARRRDLIYLWAVCASGLLLLNHQLVTGLQLENFHWNYAWTPVMMLLLWLIAIGFPTKRPIRDGRWAWVVLSAAIAFYGLGLWLRGVEATRSAGVVELLDVYGHYRDQRMTERAPRLDPNAVTAGDRRFVEFATILENQRPLDHYVSVLSPSLDDHAWEARMVLNEVLRGLDREQFADVQRAFFEKAVWGPWGSNRNPALREERFAARLRLFDETLSDPDAALDRYQVRYFGTLNRAEGSTKPPGSGWSIIQQGPTWDVWKRDRPGKRTSNNGAGANNGTAANTQDD